MQPFVSTHDGIYFYEFWNDAAVKGLKYYGGATAAQMALNGGMLVYQTPSLSGWEFKFNNFYVPGDGTLSTFSATGRAADFKTGDEVTEILMSLVDLHPDPSKEPETVIDLASGRPVTVRL